MQNSKSIILLALLIIASATINFGQKTKLEKPVECKSTLAVRGKFKTAFVGFSGGASLQVDIIVKVKDQTDSNFQAIANQLKAKYCEENIIYVAMFDSKEHKKLGSIPQPERPIEGYPRALYHINRKNDREILEIYRVVNGRIETRELLPDTLKKQSP
jgi:hypothetical protein